MAYKPRIFLVGEGKGNLIALEETGYVVEKTLQDLLADYPDLLPGDQIDPDSPRHWLHVADELGVPGGTDEADRWSLDHLFLDQDGIPTFAECKRAADSRTRREVVAQMLDYAANGVEHWSMERIRQAATETATQRGTNLDERVAELLGEDEPDVEAFWRQVETNLKDHRVRLLFVADSIPRELRRLVEFLNQEMSKVQVLAVEVRQYQRADGKGNKALVPRVLGMTESSVKTGSSPSRARKTREVLLEQCSEVARPFFARVLDVARERGHMVYWGWVGFSLRALMPPGDSPVTFAYGFPPGEFQFCFMGDSMRAEPRSSTLRKRLLDFGVFREAGVWTLKANVTAENAQLMNQVYDFIVQQVEELAHSQL